VITADDATREVLERARSLSPRDFCVRYASPFLIGGPNVDDLARSVPLDGSTVVVSGVARIAVLDLVKTFPFARIFPLAKSERNPFQDMITVGRAPNNDVRLDHPTVSKFHAYFRKVAASDWRLVDATSQNGSLVRGALVRGESRVRDGDAVAFGQSAPLRFLEPLTLYHMIRGFSSGS
jgi:hypothetical protein